MLPNNKMLKNKKANDKDKYIKLMNDFYDFNLTTNDFSNENFNDVINDFQIGFPLTELIIIFSLSLRDKLFDM